MIVRRNTKRPILANWFSLYYRTVETINCRFSLLHITNKSFIQSGITLTAIVCQTHSTIVTNGTAEALFCFFKNKVIDLIEPHLFEYNTN